MILYNITIIIEESIQDRWLEWMNTEYIPGINATNLFASNRMLKVLDSPNEGVTYCLQFIADDFGKYKDYQENFAPQFENKQHQKFENKKSPKSHSKWIIYSSYTKKFKKIFTITTTGD